METVPKIHPNAIKLLREPCFKLFTHEGLLCCIQRMMNTGCLNGYVALDESHPFFGKHYTYVIKPVSEPKFNGNVIGLLIESASDGEGYRLDSAIDVHHGLTYSEEGLNGIEDGLFGKKWWLGFDTSHLGDLAPFDYFGWVNDDIYRDFEFVEGQTKHLAKQLQLYKDYKSENK